MTSRIEHSIRSRREKGRCAFIPFLTAGYPDRETFRDCAMGLVEAGADVLEIGVPFSDPMADGPVIQAAGCEALKQGITPDVVLDLAEDLAARTSVPMIVMTYLNPVMNKGLDAFAEKAAAKGVAGVIIPDLPIDEAGEWLEAAERHGLDTVFMVAPTTPLTRARTIAEKTSGFLYYVSMTGVTGAALSLPDATLEHMAAVRGLSSAPVAAGFGVSTPEHVKSLTGSVDAVIVGSALIREIQAHEKKADQVDAVLRLASSLSGALSSPIAQSAQSLGGIA